MIYGFRGLASDFLSSHPGHHINPRRVNGSGVETLFGQLKHTTGGNLTSCNYSAAKATMLTKRSVHGRKLKDDYRDTPLCIRQPELKRKKKGIPSTFYCCFGICVFEIAFRLEQILFMVFINFSEFVSIIQPRKIC